jgi:hypothetical protein
MSTSITGMTEMSIQEEYPRIRLQFERRRCLIQPQKACIDRCRGLTSIHFTQFQFHGQDECSFSKLTVKLIPVSKSSFLAGLTVFMLSYGVSRGQIYDLLDIGCIAIGTGPSNWSMRSRCVRLERTHGSGR